MTPYSKFVDNTIFKDRTVNVFIDKMYTMIQDYFETENPALSIVNRLVLSGRAAAIMQGEEFEEVNNVVFQTDNSEVFTYIAKSAQTVFDGARCLVLKNRILIYPEGFFMEIWFSEEANDPKTFENIRIQFLPIIPEILL